MKKYNAAILILSTIGLIVSVLMNPYRVPRDSSGFGPPWWLGFAAGCSTMSIFLVLLEMRTETGGYQ